MISVQSKKLLFTLIFIIIFSFPIMAKDRVAIVSNSQAYYLSKLLKIDDDKNSIQRTNNAVGGSFIWSKDPEIKDFPKRAKKYDYAIVYFGTNELLQGYDLWRYIKELCNFSNSIHKENKNLKLIFIEIPKCKIKGYEKQIKEWNTYLQGFCKVDSFRNYCYFQCLPKNYDLKDELHVDDASQLRLWEEVKFKFNIKE